LPQRFKQEINPKSDALVVHPMQMIYDPLHLYGAPNNAIEARIRAEMNREPASWLLHFVSS
jgi:hypothetical protein